MNNTKQFLNFKQRCVDILAQSGNCQASQADFAHAETIQDMCMAWHKYWHGLITEVPLQVVAAFPEYYPVFKKEMNEKGIFYNEDSSCGHVLIGDSNEVVRLSAARNAYILGNAQVVLSDHSTALAMNKDCIVELHDNARATIKEGYSIAHDWSELTTRCSAECYDSAIVRISGGELKDYGHSAIHAYENAVVESFTDRLIELNDNAKLIIR